MLKTMRKNVKALKPTLWIIIATFVVAIFAIWGGAGRLGETEGTGALIRIGGQRISADTYFQTLRQRLEAMKREYARLDRNLIQQLNIPQQVLQEIVEKTLLLQIARDMHLGASDAEVRDKIMSYPVFQKDGRFIGFQQYKQILDYNRIKLADFEEDLKDEIRTAKVVQILTAGVTVTDDEVWADYKKKNETARIEYLVAEKDKMEAPEKPDAASIQSQFEKNKTKYRIPEKRAADYVFFKTDDLKKQIQVTEADVEKYYRDNISQFRDPEKIRVSRIHLPFAGKDKAKVQALAAELAGRAAAGADFAELARTNSGDDKAKDGGDWGYTDWASLDDRETGEIRKLDAGTTSGVVESETGASILKVTEKTPETTRPLTEVAATVRGSLEDQKARELAAEKAVRIEKAARKAKSLDVATQKEGLKIRTTGALKQGDPLEEFDPSGAFSQAVFGLKDKEISAPVYTYTGIGLAQLRSIEPEREAKLDEVRADVEKDILDIRKKEKALEKLNGVRAEIKDNWEEAAKKYGLEFKTVEAHKRDQYLSIVGESPEVDNLVFSLPVNEPSRPVPYSGGYILLRVVDRKEVARADFEKAKDSARETLLASQKNKFYRSYLVKAQAAQKIDVDYDQFLRISEDVLNRFSGAE